MTLFGGYIYIYIYYIHIFFNFFWQTYIFPDLSYYTGLQSAQTANPSSESHSMMHITNPSHLWSNRFNFRLTTYLWVCLRNRVFKSKNVFDKRFIFKLLSKCVLAIFKLFRLLKTLSIFSTKQVLFSSNKFFECQTHF
jgi:hypothetical protein